MRNLLSTLNSRYLYHDLDLSRALQIWRKANLNADEIRRQIMYDVGMPISNREASYLETLCKKLACPNSIIPNKNPDIDNKGRSDLIPPIQQPKNKKPIRKPILSKYDRVGINLFRDKIAKTYWTLKEYPDENGNKAVYLVAVDTGDDSISVNTKVRNTNDTQKTSAIAAVIMKIIQWAPMIISLLQSLKGLITEGHDLYTTIKELRSKGKNEEADKLEEYVKDVEQADPEMAEKIKEMSPDELEEFAKSHLNVDISTEESEQKEE